MEREKGSPAASVTVIEGDQPDGTPATNRLWEGHVYDSHGRRRESHASTSPSSLDQRWAALSLLRGAALPTRSQESVSASAEWERACAVDVRWPPPRVLSRVMKPRGERTVRVFRIANERRIREGH
ncbi:hypothetical protein MRX96_004699 [Rhipicephalus microplus]